MGGEDEKFQVLGLSEDEFEHLTVFGTAHSKISALMVEKRNIDLMRSRENCPLSKDNEVINPHQKCIRLLLFRIYFQCFFVEQCPLVFQGTYHSLQPVSV